MSRKPQRSAQLVAVSIMGTAEERREEEKTYIQVVKPAVAIDGDGVAEQRHAQKDEEDLVGGLLPDGLAGLGLEDVDASDEEERGAKLHSEGDGDVAHDVGPAAEVGGDAADRGGRELEGLVVDAAGGRVDGRDLAQRGGHAEDDETDEHPAPDDDDGTSALQRVVERRGQAVGDRGQNEGHEGDVPGRAGAHQFGLVAEGFEQLVGRVVVGIGLAGARRWCGPVGPGFRGRALRVAPISRRRRGRGHGRRMVAHGGGVRFGGLGVTARHKETDGMNKAENKGAKIEQRSREI